LPSAHQKNRWCFASFVMLRLGFWFVVVWLVGCLGVVRLVLRCMVCMRLRIRHLLSRLCLFLRGDLTLWPAHVCTNGRWGCLLVVLLWLVCSVWCCIRCSHGQCRASGSVVLSPPLAPPPKGRLLSVSWFGLCGACPPHFELVALAAGCLTPMDGHHSHL
jgi:hypothetical protein